MTDTDQVTTKNAYVDVYRPGDEDTPALTIFGEDVAKLEYTERAGYRKDDGEMIVTNDTGEYTQEITSGDRLDCFVEFSGEQYGPWGEMDPGEGDIWGGHRLVWSAMVRDVTHSRHAPSRSTVDLECEDFALGVMSKRKVYAAFHEQPVNAIFRQVIDDHAPEIDAYIDPSLDDVTTLTFDGKSLYDVLNRLTQRADAVIREYGNQITVKPFAASTPKFTVDDKDVGLTSLVEQDDDLVNTVRVDGPRSNAIDDNATVEDQSRYLTLREGETITFQISTRKSEVDSIDIWTNPQSDNEMSVRLQKDDDGSPIAPSDTGSDIARRTLSHEFLGDDNWTEFQMPEHTIGDSDPWVIVEAEGHHLIGSDSSGNVSRRVYYPFPIVVRSRDTSSIARYRQRDGRVVGENMSPEAAHDAVAEELRHHATIDRMVDVDSDSQRMYMLRPGEVVEFDFERDGIVGEYIVVERTDEFNSANVNAAFTMREVSTL